jgi:hypothetical protein
MAMPEAPPSCGGTKLATKKGNKRKNRPNNHKDPTWWPWHSSREAKAEAEAADVEAEVAGANSAMIALHLPGTLPPKPLDALQEHN